MSIVVTGATGQLGRLTVEALLRRGVPASRIIATGRDVAGIKDLADRGVVARRTDFADSDSLATASAGADKLLLIRPPTPWPTASPPSAGHRRHAGRGVSSVAYMSMTHADPATTILAATHRATEEYLRERDLPDVKATLARCTSWAATRRSPSRGYPTSWWRSSPTQT